MWTQQPKAESHGAETIGECFLFKTMCYAFSSTILLLEIFAN